MCLKEASQNASVLITSFMHLTKKTRLMLQSVFFIQLLSLIFHDSKIRTKPPLKWFIDAGVRWCSSGCLSRCRREEERQQVTGSGERNRNKRTLTFDCHTLTASNTYSYPTKKILSHSSDTRYEFQEWNMTFVRMIHTQQHPSIPGTGQ